MQSNHISATIRVQLGRSYVGFFLLSQLLCCATAWAQTAPDAGALLRQIEGDLKAAPTLAQQPTAKTPPALTPAPAGAVTLNVSSFAFAGNTQLSADQLAAIVAPYQGGTYSLEQLRQIANIVADAYREAGWLVRVSLPKQEVKEGVVTLQITEARFGKVVLQGRQTRVDPAMLQAMVEAAQASNDLVQVQRIDRALLLLNDIPGMTVAGNLIEGAQAGQTDLLLGADDKPAVNGNVVVDNTGSRSTGIERMLVSLNINSPLQLGDQVALSVLKTRGSQYQRVGYTVPVGYDGWRVGAYASHLTYDVMGGDFAALGLSGSSSTSGLNLSYPWVRSQATNVNLLATYDTKRFVNDNTTTPASGSNYRIDAYNVSLSGSQLDAWAGGGVSSGTVGWTSGTVNLDGSANQSTDTAGPATAGSYTKLNVGVNRLQSLSGNLSAFVALNVQQANRNLDSSERLYLGGASGVRAYPTSEGGGAQGQTLTAELRQRLDAQWTLTGFYDRGHVQAFKDNAYANGSGSLNSGSAPNNYSLSGYGASMTWQPQSGVELRATVARRVGTSPLANTSTGADTDGTRKLNRVWVNATVSF